MSKRKIVGPPSVERVQVKERRDRRRPGLARSERRRGEPVELPEHGIHPRDVFAWPGARIEVIEVVVVPRGVVTLTLRVGLSNPHPSVEHRSSARSAVRRGAISASVRILSPSTKAHVPGSPPSEATREQDFHVRWRLAGNSVNVSSGGSHVEAADVEVGLPPLAVATTLSVSPGRISLLAVVAASVHAPPSQAG